MKHLVLFILVTTYFRLNEACKKNHVVLHNELGPGKLLKFHCISFKDNLGNQTLSLQCLSIYHCIPWRSISCNSMEMFVKARSEHGIFLWNWSIQSRRQNYSLICHWNYIKKPKRKHALAQVQCRLAKRHLCFPISKHERRR